MLPLSTAAIIMIFLPCFRAANGLGLRCDFEDGGGKREGKRRWMIVDLGCSACCGGCGVCGSVEVGAVEVCAVFEFCFPP